MKLELPPPLFWVEHPLVTVLCTSQTTSPFNIEDHSFWGQGIVPAIIDYTCSTKLAENQNYDGKSCTETPCVSHGKHLHFTKHEIHERIWAKNTKFGYIGNLQISVNVKIVHETYLFLTFTKRHRRYCENAIHWCLQTENWQLFGYSL